MGEDGIVVGLDVSDLAKLIARLFFVIVCKEDRKLFEKSRSNRWMIAIVAEKLKVNLGGGS